MGLRLRRLNGPQIKQERTRVFARETKRRHIGMADHQPFAQPLHKRIQIESAIERTKGRGTDVRALATFADGIHCEHMLSAKARPRCSRRLELLSSARLDDVAASRRRIVSPTTTLGASPLAMKKDFHCPHGCGFGLFGGGASVMVVLQLRHENVSNCALCSSDLLLSMAMPQSGQCRIGGRG